MKNKKFNVRAFISLYMGVSFLVMTISGIILFVAPPGRIAHWSYWAILGLTKTEWQSVHIIFTFLFVAAGILHLVYNWKPMLNYFRTKTFGLNKIRTEMLAAVAVSLFLFVSAYYSIPPFSYVLNFGEEITQSWSDENNEPPIAHAERLTVAEFTAQLNIPLERFEHTMNRNSYNLRDVNMTIEELAKENNIVPSDIYNLIKEKTVASKSSTSKEYEQGRGYGRKMISEIFTENNYSWNQGVAILKKNGILLESDSRLKDIAVANNVSPSDIIKMLQIN